MGTSRDRGRAVRRGVELVEFAEGLEAIALALTSDSFALVRLAAFFAADMFIVRAVNNDGGHATACMYTWPIFRLEEAATSADPMKWAT